MSLIARQLESAGISTLSLTSAFDITRSANPPRAVFLDYPLGHTSGRPHQPDLNREIVTQALAGFSTMTEPGSIVQLPHRWAESDDWKDRVMRPSPGSGGKKAKDDRVGRHPDPQYQSEADEAAAAATHEGETCLVCAGIDY